MTTDEINAKAEELTLREGVKVYPMIFPQASGVDVVGYLKEPSRMTKIRVMDKAMSMPITASYELFEACLLSADSDAIFTSERPEHDAFILGATMAAYNLVIIAVDSYKKK